MNEICVTFLNVKKSNKKPSADVYCLGCNVLKSKSADISATLQVITSNLQFIQNIFSLLSDGTAPQPTR